MQPAPFPRRASGARLNPRGLRGANPLALNPDWVRRPSTLAPGDVFATDELGRPDAVPRIQAEAQAYNLRYNLPPIDHTYIGIDQRRGGRIADAYNAMPLNDDANPAVAEAYGALAREVQQQWASAVAHGMTFEAAVGDADAYHDSVFEMVADVRDHHHLWFFTGGEPNRFMARLDVATGLPVNDLFRAIHDYFGHCAMGADFGVIGEENAWVAHSQMFTLTARRALTVETRGQNSWVNFGRQNYDLMGRYLNLPPTRRPFAVQKTGIFDGVNDWINQLPINTP